MDQTADHSEPRLARTNFVRLLENARRAIVSKPGPDGTVRDGSYKSLAMELRISPARLGDFLRENFKIEIADKSLNPPRLRKSIIGFSASVERTIAWLVREGLSEGLSLDLAQIVKGYLPASYLEDFDEKFIGSAIEEGRQAARPDIDQLEKIAVELWAVTWGPFGDKKDIEENDDAFFSAYGADLIRAIDPIHANVRTYPKSLSEILELPARDRRKGLAIGMGPFETLHRKFRGFEFVTIPAMQFPIVCLLIAKDDATLETKQKGLSKFPEFLASDGNIRRAVVTGDIGQLVQLSVLPETAQAAIIPLTVDSSVSEQLISKLSEVDGPIAFISDGMLAFETFVRLKSAGVSVRVMAQKLPEPDFLFSLGIMLRKDDKDMVALIEQAQRQIFRSGWRICGHLTNFLDGIRRWLDRENCPSEILRDWNATPIFIVSDKMLKNYLGSAVVNEGKAASILKEILIHLRREADERGLNDLFDIQDDTKRQPR